MDVSFKARARTLDMLGRQQIAGIPTAISELFKNAHDADAERVEVDYYRRDGLFVLRDDGFGMETHEFVDRWLTIATETSIERKRAARRRPKSGKRRRPILGEKGIGRLAIATIAPQVLVLTRALRHGVLSDLTADIAGDPNDDVAAPLQKALLGFTTPPFANGGAPVIRTAFRDHGTDGSWEDLIGENEFFTRYDYENADHQISGNFDRFGQFKGSISVYGETVRDHVINWTGGKGRPTACGPFHIRFAAVEGAARHSTLPPAEHGRMLRKTRRIGGLYIYRDGVRIQPYGNTDYDWLAIELRRTKSASYYYFSYRQMFGVVEVDSTHNRSLQEKAGREGFRENKAYRQLRAILRSFLVQVAADFFREEGVHGERFAARKRELLKSRVAKGVDGLPGGVRGSQGRHRWRPRFGRERGDERGSQGRCGRERESPYGGGADRGTGGRQSKPTYDHIPESIAVALGEFRTRLRTAVRAGTPQWYRSTLHLRGCLWRRVPLGRRTEGGIRPVDSSGDCGKNVPNPAQPVGMAQAITKRRQAGELTAILTSQEPHDPCLVSLQVTITRQPNSCRASGT